MSPPSSANSALAPTPIRQPNNPPRRLRRRRPRNLQPAKTMATSPRHPARLHRQHRRPNSPLDQRPLGLHPPSRRKSPARFHRLHAPPIRSLLPPTKLGRRNHLHPHLPRSRRKTKVSARPQRRIPNAKVPQHSKTKHRRPKIDFAISSTSTVHDTRVATTTPSSSWTFKSQIAPDLSFCQSLSCTSVTPASRRLF